MIEETTRELIKLFRTHFFPEDFETEKEEDKHVRLSAGSIVEIAKLPAIVLNGPLMSEKKRLMRDPERITAIDVEAGKAVREVPPRWYDVRFDVNLTCTSNLELIRLMEKCSRLNQACPLLTAVNDERERQYLWRWEKFPDTVTAPNISQVYQGRGELIVYDVEIYSGIREVWPLIEKIQIEVQECKNV